MAVRQRIYRPLIKKFCMLRLGRLPAGVLIKPFTFTCSNSYSTGMRVEENSRPYTA